MLPPHGLAKSCSLLAVVCGRGGGAGRERGDAKGRKPYPFPVVASSGRLEVHTLANPSADKFREALWAANPSVLYCQGELEEGEEEVGSLVWGGVDFSEPEAFCSLVVQSVPNIVYLEVPNSEKLAEALRAKGVPYVVYWKHRISIYFGSHFRRALFSVIQSSSSHIWDAFQLAHASFRLYCVQNNNSLGSQKATGKLGPRLLGEAPIINVPVQEKNLEDEEEDLSEALPAIKIYDDDVDIRFLVCGIPSKSDSSLLNALEEGLNALLKIEIRGSKLHNRVSAAPPPLQAGNLTRGVVTMRCDMTTCSSAHISLLVSGSAQTCFDDQLLETHIKNELVENSQLVYSLSGENKLDLPEPRRSSSVACGAATTEVRMKVPLWASQVLRQLAPEACYRSLVALGIASIEGLTVASFDQEDAECLLFFNGRQDSDMDYVPWCTSSWFASPVPRRKRATPDQEMKLITKDDRSLNGIGGRNLQSTHAKKRQRSAAMRPIPHTRQHKMLPFSVLSDVATHDVSQPKPSLAIAPSVKHVPPLPVTQRKSFSNSLHAQQLISLNPLPLKKHNCGRAPIQVCPEEEFSRDVMQFLILRGHSRLVPPGGISEFPDAILNAKRLDLYNLYREVVSRGGFNVGNGINWKGQVFSKMKNHTLTNRMTGVGNTLKRHYETYLLEYELAHDDVDGECCLLCDSSAPGDWVNCGLCGEWAHFGCDRRQGLGAFKDYAKTDGLDYVCPQCSVSNFRRKSQKVVNGIS